MSEQPAWLKRLEASTSYQELHDVFAEIVKYTQSNLFSPALIEPLDAALSKVSAELNRDLEKRKQFEEELTSTKQANKGVVGWFKRTMPFSDARKQIDAHQQAIDSQTREIWADKLLILRLRLLKELSLPSDKRSLGRRPKDWQQTFSPLKTYAHVAELAALANSLQRELAAAQPILAGYEKDLAVTEAELAALAPLTGPTDQTLVKGMGELHALGLRGPSPPLPLEILESAKKELALLSGELVHERIILAGLLKDICTLAAEELDKTDKGHQQEQERCRSLGNSGIGPACGDAKDPLERLISTAGTLSDLCSERAWLPGQLDHLGKQLGEAQEELPKAIGRVESTLVAIEEPKDDLNREKPIFLQRQQLITQQKQIFQDKQKQQQQLVQEQQSAKEAVAATQRAFEGTAAEVEKKTKQWKGLSDDLADLRRQLALNEKQFEQRVKDHNVYQDRIKQQAENAGQQYIRPPEPVNNEGINLKNRADKMETEREIIKRELDIVTQRLEPARAAREQAPKNLEAATRRLQDNTPPFDTAKREFAKQSEEFDRAQSLFRQKEKRYETACAAHTEAQKWHRQVQTRISELETELARLRTRQFELEKLVVTKAAEVAGSFDATADCVGRLIGLLAPFQVPGTEFKAASYAPDGSRWVSGQGLQPELKAALIGGPNDLGALKIGISCLEKVKAWRESIVVNLNAEIARLSRAREERWKARCVHLIGSSDFAALNGSMSTTPRDCTVQFKN